MRTQEQQERRMYLVTDRNDKDRTDPVIDCFASRQDAEAFALGWLKDSGYVGTLAEALADGIVQIETD